MKNAVFSPQPKASKSDLSMIRNHVTVIVWQFVNDLFYHVIPEKKKVNSLPVAVRRIRLRWEWWWEAVFRAGLHLPICHCTSIHYWKMFEHSGGNILILFFNSFTLKTASTDICVFVEVTFFVTLLQTNAKMRFLICKICPATK